jgi:aminoglycoside phosphotransferase (APT) family kinase protein
MPDSLTKRRVGEETLSALVREAFGPDVRIARCRELNDGFFNTAFRVLLDDARDVVVKVSPPPGAALLRYERDIMRAEAVFFRAAAGAPEVPLPELLYTGFGRTALDGDFLVLSALDGVTWYACANDLGERERAALHAELGAAAAHLHTVTNTAGLFGYPAVPELSARTWPDAFAAMLDGLLHDARTYGVELPLPARRLLDLALDDRDSLAVVTEPVLVHFDLWPGNVFVSAPGGTPPRITGLIDGERVIWGDPLMEFVGMDVFGRADENPDIVTGYLGAGGRIARDEAAGRRLALYHLYMHLLLLIEMTPRGYTDPAHLEWCSRECPKRILAAADRLA